MIRYIRHFGKVAALLLALTTLARAQDTTRTPAQTRAAWEQLTRTYPDRCRCWQAGPTDCGLPLQVCALGQPVEPLSRRRHPVLLVLNAIHPGEPDGVDASIAWAERLLRTRDPLLDSLALVVVPFYNLDGGLVRGCCSRASQLGPPEVGFRGNARNLDLNRDFVKADARNTQTFHRLFHRIDPDLFADTHTTNGADYIYPMTLIATQPDKLGGPLADWLRSTCLPRLYATMEASSTPMSPYVYTRGATPETGLIDFLETPRYSTGYAALFQTVGFVTEAHMLKPFAVRVQATERLLDGIARVGVAQRDTLLALRRQARVAVRQQVSFPLRWQLDTTRWQNFEFRGYTLREKPSRVSGLPRRYYDRNQPWTAPVRYYDRYTGTDSVRKPLAYLIPQAWHEVIDRLRLSGVKLRFLDMDLSLPVESYYIDHCSAPREPYEGHYLHDSVRVRRVEQVVAFRRGDCLVELGSDRDRFIVETLEPHAPDSYFAWNFFDAVLMQKEGFSDYVFEETAAELLERNPSLQAALDSARQADPALAASAYRQLLFIYHRSPYYEASHRRYPVYRLRQWLSFPIYEDLRVED